VSRRRSSGGPLDGLPAPGLVLLAIASTQLGASFARGLFDDLGPAGTVFLRVAKAAYRMRELHDRLNRGIFFCEEQWPYMPHLTIVKMAAEEQAVKAFDIARNRWKEYSGTPRLVVEELTFVREGENNTWVDLRPIPLGRSLVSGNR